jgi:metallo-beta-lactamase class B
MLAARDKQRHRQRAGADVFLTVSAACRRQQAGVPGFMRPWNRPGEPFRVAGNVHLVGKSGMGVYLITTPAGHIPIDSAFEASGS